ncbi:MAG: hypothetical protein ACOX6U_08775 [Oscillospiraceae bacterium]|jgi:hypothetical protein
MKQSAFFTMVFSLLLFLTSCLCKESATNTIHSASNPSIPIVTIKANDEEIPYTAIVRTSDAELEEDKNGTWFVKMREQNRKPINIPNGTEVTIRFPSDSSVTEITLIDHELVANGENKGLSPYGLMNAADEELAERIQVNTRYYEVDSNNEIHFALPRHNYFIAEQYLPSVERLRGIQMKCSMNGQRYDYYFLFTSYDTTGPELQ